MKVTPLDLFRERHRLEASKRASAQPRRRIQLPVLRSAHPGCMELTGEMIAEVEMRLDAGDVRQLNFQP